MSDHVFALLILPPPPQRLSDVDDIRAALYQPLERAVEFIRNEGPSSTLEIALPIYRFVQVYRRHRSLFANVSVLLANVYALLASIYQEKQLEIGSEGPVDSRILLVIDDDNPFAEPQSLPCGTVQFTTLARSRRPWTHVLAVDGEQGMAYHRWFTRTAVEENDRYRPKTKTLAGGIQLYFPDQKIDVEGDIEEPLHKSSNHDTLIAIEGGGLDFTDKYVLTMGLFSMETAPPRRFGQTPPSQSEDQPKVYIATMDGDLMPTAEGNEKQQRTVIEFLLSLLDFGEPKALATYTSKPDNMDASQPLSSIEQKFRIQCLVNSRGRNIKGEHAGLTTMIVSKKDSAVAGEVNQVRAERGWKELQVIELESIQAFDGWEVVN